MTVTANAQLTRTFAPFVVSVWAEPDTDSSSFTGHSRDSIPQKCGRLLSRAQCLGVWARTPKAARMTTAAVLGGR